MNTQQLRCFLAAADKSSFTKAAQELYFTVPTVTHHIQSLEHELQTQLFIRGKKGISLTGSGRLFYPAAMDILNRYKSVMHSINNDIEYDVLKIGCTSYAEVARMIPVFRVFRNTYPQILPHVDIENYDQILDMLEDHQLDLAFVTKDMLNGRSKNCFFHQLAVSVNCAVVDRSHPLSVESSLSFDALNGFSLIGQHKAFVPFNSEDKIPALMQLHHLHYSDILIEDDRMILTLCEAGYGIAVLPSYCIPHFPKESALIPIPIKESLQTPYGIIRRKSDSKEYIKHFIHLVSTQKKEQTRSFDKLSP